MSTEKTERKPRSTYPRSMRINLSLTEAEKSLITRAAGVVGVSPAKWAREELLSRARLADALVGLSRGRPSRLRPGINHFGNPGSAESTLVVDPAAVTGAVAKEVE